MKSKDDIQKEALDTIRSLKRCSVGISMGVGKTRIGLLHMAENYTPTIKYLVVAPKKSIFTTWKDEALKFNLEYLLKHITFSTYRSFIKQDLNYNVVYLDEFHSLKDSHEPWLSSYQNSILGLSGTPPKFSSSEKGRLVNKFCPVVYKYFLKLAVDDKILNDYSIVVHMIGLSTVKNLKVKFGNKEWFTSEYDSYQYWNKRLDNAVSPKDVNILRIMRMKALQQFPSKEKIALNLLETSSEKIILFANTQEQADRMCLHSYHANNKYSEEYLLKFKQGLIKKLSCVLQLSEGVNIPNLKHGIVMHSYGNERKLQQRLGRLLRLNPDDVATAHILCYKDTVDEQWVKNALSDFDPLKIKFMWH